MDADFSRYLAPHESVRWTGQPAQGVMLQASDLTMIPFTLLWCGFAIFWETSVIKMGAPFFFMLWGVPFVGVGLYMVFGRFFFDAYVRSRTRYALTDTRALILSGAFGTRLTSVELATLSELNYKPLADGRGTIVFGAETPFSNFRGFGRRYAAASPQFFRIENADYAYTLIQRQRQPK